MAVETEFKFVIDRLPIEAKDTKPYEIVQIYFDGEKKYNELKTIFPDVDFTIIHTYRFRMIKYNGQNKFVVTLKSKGEMSRFEYEKEVDETTAKSLYENNIISIIIKNRYVVKEINSGYTFEFDQYLDLKSPLLTCEVEVDNFDIENKRLEIKEILINDYKLDVIDVTNDHRYKNSNLKKYF